MRTAGSILYPPPWFSRMKGTYIHTYVSVVDEGKPPTRFFFFGNSCMLSFSACCLEVRFERVSLRELYRASPATEGGDQLRHLLCLLFCPSMNFF